MKLIFCLLFFVGSHAAFAQKSAKDDGLAGTYYFYNDDTTIRYILKLDNNKLYNYTIINDLVEKKSRGRWGINKDTIFLTSEYQQDNIGVKVSEHEGGGNGVDFGAVKNAKGQIFSNALVYINGDTTTICDPLGGTCKFARGSVGSITVIVGKAISATYKVKDIRATQFSIVLDVDNYLDSYLFLKRDKFLFRNGLIYPLVRNKIDSVVVNGNINIPIALAK